MSHLRHFYMFCMMVIFVTECHFPVVFFSECTALIMTFPNLTFASHKFYLLSKTKNSLLTMNTSHSLRMREVAGSSPRPHYSEDVKFAPPPLKKRKKQKKPRNLCLTSNIAGTVIAWEVFTESDRYKLFYTSSKFTEIQVYWGVH